LRRQTIFSNAIGCHVTGHSMNKDALANGLWQIQSKGKHGGYRTGQHIPGSGGCHTVVTAQIDKHALIRITDQRMGPL
jgi:hypothetical protein